MSSSKRKRAATLESKPVLETAQPSSRDASEEDVEDPVLQEVSSLKHHNTNSSKLHPAKRSRSDNSENGNDVDAADQAHTRRGRKERISTQEGGEPKNGEAGTMSMEEPPKAGAVDPVGYHTNPPPTGRPVRIYADGVFDLFHLGHMRQLQQAKQAFPDVHLIVGVTGDKETHRRKGLTVLSGKERAESVRHCKWVDEVIEDCPWIITVEFMDQHMIDYVAHDDIPYGANEGDDIYAPIKKAGKFLVTQRTEGVSTTGIITKVIRDYDQYIARQLKRGTPRQELNVSWLKKNELDIKRNMSELRDNIKTNWTTAGQEIGRELHKFWQNSRPASPAPSIRERSEADNATSPTVSSLKSPTALARLSHLDIPKSQSAGSSDFAAGYSLGLIGGVRSWMSRSRRTLNDNRAPSPDSADDSISDKSPKFEPERGRRGKSMQDEVDAQVDSEMNSPRVAHL
ncbi:Nucleotidylyl transferase [Rhizodiscina lignyota]|uniref:choline-phosphate cytidylyltransferase n=1 Tax=Rhizodiscina lignyota TaxID=1504668 RepID=A0A9P4IEM2_9PEZI|nr:Nucleotidylyl transferase [Rhizodiscina lignyota]